MFDIEKFREKIKTKLNALQEEWYGYYELENMSEDDEITRDGIRNEIELLQWVIEEAYKNE